MNMTGARHKNRGHSPVVIIGGGIVGMSTAYYLALARKDGHSIIIVDNAAVLFAGASGKANGILGDYGFKPEAESLGKLSWELHQHLASRNNGRAGWGYRDVMIYDLDHAASSDASKFPLSSAQPPSPLPAWCMDMRRHSSTLKPDHEHAARINPADFCMFLQKSCEKRGVRILLEATITGVGMDHGSLKSITVTRMKTKWTLECHSLVIAAGPWSESVLGGLFPDSQVRIPSSKQPSSGNYLVVKIPRWGGSQDTKVCHQIYLEGVLGHKVDISSRPDGTLYIGGSLSAKEELPETTTDIRPQFRYVRDMQRLAEKALGCSSDDMKVVDEGRAYRPDLEYGRPIITRVSLDELLGMRHRDTIEGKEAGGGGVYLNVGHGCDGITLGPASGKVMSELIEGGRALSANISGLGIS